MIEEATESHRRLVAQTHVLLHLRTAQVKHTVLQAHHLRQVFVVKLEGRRHRGIQDFDVQAQDFHRTAGDVRIHRPGRTGAHLADDLQAVFIAHRFGDFEGFRAIRIANDLRKAIAIPEVDEDDPPVVTATMRPAAKGDLLADGL